MTTVIHNTHRLKDGKPMQAAGQRASFLKYLGDAVKGHVKDGLSPLVNYRQGAWQSAFAGAPTPVHVTRIGVDLYVISWKRPAGRAGIATGTKDVERHVTVRCPIDLVAYVALIDEHPEPVDLEPVG